MSVMDPVSVNRNGTVMWLVTALQTITLVVSAWALMRIVDLGARVLAIETAMRLAGILK